MDKSEGGVTFSGGESLLHHEFLITLIDACGEEGIHRCVDTTGYTSPEVLIEVAKRTKHFLYDLKMMDLDKHRKRIGMPNQSTPKRLQEIISIFESRGIRPMIGG